MPELFLITKNFILDNPILVTWSVVVFLLILGFLTQMVWVKEYIAEWKLNYLLKSMGVKSLHNISISDGTDEKVFIEHLILTSNNILLLGVKRFRGLIFAAEKIDLWTQVLGNKSYKFENPLHQLEYDMGILNSKLENTKIVGKVLFIKGSEFPKGKPEDVISVLDIKGWVQNNINTDVSKGLLDDWNQLTELAVSSDLEKEILIGDRKSLGLNIFSLVMILVLIVLWLVWRLN